MFGLQWQAFASGQEEKTVNRGHKHKPCDRGTRRRRGCFTGNGVGDTSQAIVVVTRNVPAAMVLTSDFSVTLTRGYRTEGIVILSMFAVPQQTPSFRCNLRQRGETLS